MYDATTDTKLTPIDGFTKVRRVRTVPGSTLCGGLAPWVQAYAVTYYVDRFGRPLVQESGFGHPFRMR